jgi:hypothetical protein
VHISSMLCTFCGLDAVAYLAPSVERVNLVDRDPVGSGLSGVVE